MPAILSTPAQILTFTLNLRTITELPKCTHYVALRDIALHETLLASYGIQSAPDIIPITCDCPYGMTGHTIHANPANRPAKRKLPSIPAPLPFRGEAKGTGRGVYGKSVPVCAQASVHDDASTMNVPRPPRASNIYTLLINHRPTPTFSPRPCLSVILLCRS